MWQIPEKAAESASKVISYKACPAKTHQLPGGAIGPGRTVLQHCQIVGEVARGIISRYPSNLADALFPNGAIMAAASHDVGKVSPCFYEKLRRNFSAERSQLEPLKNINPALETQWGGHAGVSQVTAKALGAPSYVPEILGQHHGYSPPVAGLRATDENFGGPAWQEERSALVEDLKGRLGCDWPIIESAAQARVLAGLTSVADWIGSGPFFEDPQRNWQQNVQAALDNAGFVCPTYRQGLSFRQIFGFEARPAQIALINAVSAPGVYVLEAPMGLGKTEAALYASYTLLTKHQACGVYFALPTQLTSNKIYERFNQFLEIVLSPDCSHRALLLHQKAWLTATEMGEDGRPGGAWFNQSKRGLLAPFAVGTLDQALMATMNVKHGFVRAFGLAGKVVVLDEVHTYDTYTGTLLDALVALLRQLRCTVIILSATLSNSRRAQILGLPLRNDAAYPLIVSAPLDRAATEIPVTDGSCRHVQVQLHNCLPAALDEALLRAGRGQQVLWIENTVAEAQARYLDLAARAAEIGVSCGLLHSRFVAHDRQAIEDDWVRCYGKQGWPTRLQHGRILVGTQILEQSLDIDADYLVTRFAPTDMLLQRLGRLWRHTETPRPFGASAQALVLAPDLAEAEPAPVKAFGPTAHVYSPYVLCRSLQVWKDLSHVSLPEDIRWLIEQTYMQRDESGPMHQWLYELDNGTARRKGRIALAQLARVTLAEQGKTLPESKAQTRYSDQENCDVLLLRMATYIPERNGTRIVLLSGDELFLPRGRHQLSPQQWRDISALLMRQTVSVNVTQAPETVSVSTLTKLGLHHCFYLGDPAQNEALLRVCLVDNAGQLTGLNGACTHQKYVLHYREDMGYRAMKEPI